MPPPVKRGFWRKVRQCFRFCRVAFLLAVLFLVGGLVYLNSVGLPGFLKSRLVAELRARGVNLAFTRLRLHWYHGLVAENLSLGRAADPSGAHLSIGEADLRLDPTALLRLHLQVNSLKLHEGRLSLLLISSNAPTEQFVMNDIVTELRLLPDDQWELDHFQARCLGARVQLSGRLAHASAVRDWRFQHDTNQPAGLWQARLREAINVTRQMRFSRQPEIALDVQGDAREPARITADLRFEARDADTSWGKLEKLALLATLNRPSATNDAGRSELDLRLENAKTQWGNVGLCRLHAGWAQSFTNPMPAEAKLDWELLDVAAPWGEIPQARFTGRSLQSPDGSGLLKTELTLDSGVFQSQWLQSRTNHFTARLTHSPGNLVPVEAAWQWQVDRPQSRWGDSQRLQFNGQLTRMPTNDLPEPDGSWAWWAKLEPFAISWDARIDQLSLTNIFVNEISLGGEWRAPQLLVKALHADLYGHKLDASAQVNVATRETKARGNFDFDLHQIESLLTSHTEHWLDQYTWTSPPEVTFEGRAVLPAWTDAHPDWRAEVLPTLQLHGDLRAGEAAFRGVPVSSARSHFSFSNFVWQLPDFVATRPEGSIEFSHTSDIQTHDFHFKVRSRMDLMALKPLFEQERPNVFDYFRFNGPVQVEGNVWGRWRDPARLGVIGTVSATNFVFREVPVSDLTAAIQFTNRFVSAANVLIGAGGPHVSASGVGFDLETQTVFITNAVSTVDPKLVTHVIGPRTEKTLSPYTFQTPPTAHVDGWVEVRHGKKSDLRFELSGGPFTYWRFNVPQISGVVRWADEMVTITNLQADFYGGKLAAGMFFDCTAPHEADFNLHADVANADLHRLMADLSSPTNRLEGTFSGELTVTKANTADWGSWNGLGKATLHDGFLWGIPLFGILSPVLNAVIPGLGSSRMSGGTATFNVTNSVIHTDDMEIRSPAMRLAYRGMVDFKGNVNARVEARLLRDAWVIGPLVSFVLSPLTKVLEYKVTGTLSEPKKEPLYIPKPLMFPFHPFQTLKEILSEEKQNPPAEKPAPQQ